MSVNREIIRDFVREHYAHGVSSRILLYPLAGGLESAGTVLAEQRRPKAAPIRFVVKVVPPEAHREIAVYRELQAHPAPGIAPRLLGWRSTCGGPHYVFLEYVQGREQWPWSNTRSATMVLRQLARVHEWRPEPLLPVLRSWDYDAELLESARSTVSVYEHLQSAGMRPGRPALRVLQRLAERLPQIRRQLAAFSGTAVLHGDAHPGNALITGTAEASRAVLLDWGRTRTGSALEDVCSWVQTLACWEPAVRRKHDTLVCDYLSARGCSRNITGEFRDAFRLAATCNAFSGALRYHLAVTGDEERQPLERQQSWLAATDYLRILRRADACWKN